jgi:hypothetical protein
LISYQLQSVNLSVDFHSCIDKIGIIAIVVLNFILPLLKIQKLLKNIFELHNPNLPSGLRYCRVIVQYGGQASLLVQKIGKINVEAFRILNSALPGKLSPEHLGPYRRV